MYLCRNFFKNYKNLKIATRYYSKRDMCISGEIHDKWPPLIEFFIWILFQVMCIGSHYGIWALIPEEVINITPPLYINKTVLGNSSSTNDSNLIKDITSLNFTMVNLTKKIIFQTGPEQWEDLFPFRRLLLIFCIVGTVIFIIHVSLLIPNIVQGFKVKEPAMLKETGNAYFRNILKIHCMLLITETLVFDIPAGCISMEILSQIWEGPLSDADNMRISKIILTLSMIGLAFISLYKGA